MPPEHGTDMGESQCQHSASIKAANPEATARLRGCVETAHMLCEALKSESKTLKYCQVALT